jgi:hypothetical protein
VITEPSEAAGPWEIWCPHWWVQEGGCRLIEIGTEFDVPVGFDFGSDWRTGPPRTATARKIGRGRYAVDSAEVVDSPRSGDGASATWDVQLGELRLSTDAWDSASMARARLLRPGDHLSGNARLQLDPTHEGSATLLRTERIELQAVTGDWAQLDERSAAWTSVSTITTEATIGRPDFAIVLTCSVIDRTAASQ